MPKLTNEFDLTMDEKIIALSNLSTYNTRRNIKSSYNSNKCKMSAPTWINLNYLTDRILYEIFKIIPGIF